MFHWICPECGREIPPSVRECQACDPQAAPLPVVESIESKQVAQAVSASLLPETVALPAPSALLLLPAAPAAEPEIEDLDITQEFPIRTLAEPPAVVPVADVAPVVAVTAPAAQALEVAPVIETPAEPVAEELRVVESTPVLVEAEPVIEAVAEPVAEELPTVAAAPVVVEQPVAEAAPVIETPAEAVAEELPVVESTPVLVEAAPVIETVAEPVVEELPTVAAAPVVVEQPVAEAAPVVETLAEETLAEPVAPVLIEAAPPEPVAEVPPPVVAEATPEPVVQLQDVPDPLLVLAEEIRAAQVAHAAALAEPPSSNGLLGLAEAVGVQSPSVEPLAPSEPVSRQVEPAATIEQIHAAQEAVATAESTTAVALLAPPMIVPEPVSFHELRPVALAPEPQPAAEPEPFNQPEPPAEPVALAPEPQPEPEGPTLPFAPMQDYKAATSRSIQPVPPRAQILAADSGPRITLPGPTLPPELTRLQDANVLTVIGENTAQRTKEAIPPPKSASAPGYLVSTFVALLLLAAGLGIVFFLLQHTAVDAKPVPTPAVAATSPVPTGGNSPLAKFIEVTGFRIVTSSPEANKKEATKKSEVQYLVVNHSDADISDANVFVTLRSAKPGQPPVCRFSFKVPSLGPFESKEMSSPIGNSTRSISLPDWQEIRAEVQISQ